MQTVRIAFPPPPATAAEFDTAAAQTWMALRDARTVGRAVDVALDGSFAYYDFDMGLVFAAQDAVKRAAAALPAAAPGDGARKAAAEELKRAATEAGSYLGILAEAVDTAIKESRSGKGSAARGVHAKAQAQQSRMVADAAKLAAVQDTSAFKGALPPDRQAEVGGPRPAQDLELGADYCHCRPAVVAVVDKGGLAERQLKLEPGDVLRSADGKPLASLWDLKVALRAAAGRKLKLAIERDGRAREIEVKAPAAP
jgi:C-terminal processing protease CtpA/Prc